MNLSDFDFPFDASLIASEPVLPRHEARLLCLDSRSHEITHRHVSDLPAMLEPGDLLVVNDTKVVAARLSGTKQPTVDGAASDYQALYVQLPTVSRVHYGLGEIAFRRKHNAEGIKYYELYVKYAAPDTDEARLIASRLQQLKAAAP